MTTSEGGGLLKPACQLRTAGLLSLFWVCGCSAEEVVLNTHTFQIAGQQYSEQQLTQFKLPAALTEISGLALSPAGLLYTHDDERATIYQVDFKAGRITTRFKSSAKIRDDFEGIAVTENRLYLVNSEGTIYEAPFGRAIEPANPSEAPSPAQGADSSAAPRLDFTRHSQKLPCEVESLTYIQGRQTLLAACKNLSKKHKKTALRIYQWNIENHRYDPDPYIEVSSKSLRNQLGAPFSEFKKFQPTGITTLDNGHLLILAGKQQMLIELTDSGEVFAIASLPGAQRHPQAEGIAITADGQLLLADEGTRTDASLHTKSKKSKGRLSVYYPTR